MNLVTDPWIPVVRSNGAHRLVSLREAFAESKRIADLSANPCQRVALTQLLICIAQAALDGPADDTEWRTSKDRIVPAALDYLDRWHPRFNLFGEKAFLQVEGLEEGTNALADKLDLTRVCGNTTTLFDQESAPEGRTPTPAKLALDVLVYQVYSPGGTIGQLEWDGAVTVKSCELSPALEGSLLHTIVRGASLLDSIHANLLTKEQQPSWGAPVWELTRFRRPDIESNTRTYLGRLVPITRSIRCGRNSAVVTLAAAVSCSKLPEGREPMATVVLRRRGTSEELGYVAVNLSKHPWRDLGSILSLSKTDDKGGALALMHVRELPGDFVDIWTGGLSADKSKLLDMAEWSFCLPVAMMEELPIKRYEQGVELANRGESALRDAVNAYAAKLKGDGGLWSGGARAGYWAALDGVSGTLIEAAASDDGSLHAWERHVLAAMRAAYEQACPHETPRQLQAFAVGLRKLRLGKEGKRE